jgi:hypothetical protein
MRVFDIRNKVPFKIHARNAIEPPTNALLIHHRHISPQDKFPIQSVKPIKATHNTQTSPFRSRGKKHEINPDKYNPEAAIPCAVA